MIIHPNNSTTSSCLASINLPTWLQAFHSINEFPTAKLSNYPSPLYHGWALASWSPFMFLVCLLFSFSISWSPWALFESLGPEVNMCVFFIRSAQTNTLRKVLEPHQDFSGCHPTRMSPNCWKSSGTSCRHSLALSCGSSSALWPLGTLYHNSRGFFCTWSSSLSWTINCFQAGTSTHLYAHHSSIGFSHGLFYTMLSFS